MGRGAMGRGAMGWGAMGRGAMGTRQGAAKGELVLPPVLARGTSGTSPGTGERHEPFWTSPFECNTGYYS